ncbi:MAG: hypothetical protein HY897_12990 [Deltaproteobacteria bacterium]|nr:hypothetical protein [Deltaproteobacteria bacterium]
MSAVWKAVFPAACLAIAVASAAAGADEDFPAPDEYNPASFKWGITSAESDFMAAFLALFPKESAPAVDPKLCAAARGKSEELAGLPKLPRKLDSSSFRPLLWKYGVVEFQYLPVSFVVDDIQSDLRALKDYVSSTSQDGFSSCGFGLAPRKGGGRVATVICAKKIAEISPIGRQYANGSNVVLKGVLLQGYTRPRVFVSQPSGQVSKIEPGVGAEGFGATLKFDGGPGKYLVQVMATGKSGPEVAVVVPVYVEIRMADIMKDITSPLVTTDPSKGVDAKKAEEMLGNAINFERSKMNLKPLKPLAELHTLAKTKSKLMADAKQFGHNVKKVSLESSLKHAMVTYSTAGENIGVNSSPKMGHYLFMNSPAHRANILSSVMTRFGVGVEKTKDTDEYYITEIFVCLEDY